MSDTDTYKHTHMFDMCEHTHSHTHGYIQAAMKHMTPLYLPDHSVLSLEKVQELNRLCKLLTKLLLRLTPKHWPSCITDTHRHINTLKQMLCIYDPVLDS